MQNLYYNDILKPDSNILSTHTMLNMNQYDTHLNNNTAIIGATGSGKSQLIECNLLALQNQNAVVIDVKGTLYKKYKKQFQDKGYMVNCFNVKNLNESDCYNPLNYVKNDQQIYDVASTIMARQKNSARDPYWPDAAEILLTALIAAVVYEFPSFEKNLYSVEQLLSRMEQRDDDFGFKNAVDLWFENLEKKDPDHVAVRNYNKYKINAGRTKSCIISTAQAGMKSMSFDDLKRVISSDDMHFEAFGNKSKKKVIFVITDEVNNTNNWLLDIFYQQLFSTTLQLADDTKKGCLPRHLRVILDDFAGGSIYIDKFDRFITCIRQREISFHFIIQNIAQLADMYSELKMQTILGNCDNILFLGGVDLSTIRWLEERTNFNIDSDTLYNMNRDQCFVVVDRQCYIDDKIQAYMLNKQIQPESLKIKKTSNSNNVVSTF